MIIERTGPVPSKDLCREGSVPAVILDRDGVIIENNDHYVKTWADVRFLQGAVCAVAALNRNGYVVTLATNQSAVGRGVVSMEQALKVNRMVTEFMLSRGARIDSSYICPHRPDDGCTCRKPQPGMILRACEDLSMDPSRTWFIGDALSDVEAAEAANVRPILVKTGRGKQFARGLEEERFPRCIVASDLEDAVGRILRLKSARESAN